MLSRVRPPERPEGMFTYHEHALMAGWFDELAVHGFSAVIDCAYETVPERLLVFLPGSHRGPDWGVHYRQGVFRIERVSARARALLFAADMRSTLRFVAPVPPGSREPAPLSGARLRRIWPNGPRLRRA